MTTLLAQRTDTSVPVTLSLSASSVGPVTGETCTVAVRDGSTSDSYLDFADSTFKIAGWVTKRAALTEIEAGLYELTGGLDIAAMTNLPPTTHHLILEHQIGAPVVTVAHDALVLGVYDPAAPGDAMSLVPDAVNASTLAASAAAEISTKVWDEPLPGAHAAGSAGALVPIIDYIRKLTGNRLEINLTTQKLVLYDDDGTTVLQQWALETDAGPPLDLVITQPGVQTKRKVPEL